MATKIDVQGVCGADHKCAGVKASIEAAVHAMRDRFEADETEGLLHVNVRKGFNMLNRPAAL